MTRFRGKRAYNGEWLYGYCVRYARRCYITDGNLNEDGLPSLYEVDGDTVSEWTGVHDSDGELICEGDIVSTKYGRLCEVTRFISPTFNGWDLRPIESEHRAPDLFDYWSNLTVVGNKWDNPELLNEDVRDGT